MDKVAKCPKCKTGSVSANHRAYGCSNYRDDEIMCEFTVWREISGKEITLKDLMDLCQKGTSDKTKFKPKNGDEYTGFYKLNSDYKLEIIKVSWKKDLGIPYGRAIRSYLFTLSLMPLQSKKDNHFNP